MRKIDFKKDLKHLYNASAKEVSIIDVPPMNFLMVDGEGDPNKVEGFKDAIEVLFTISYTLKFMIKRSDLAIDYGVLPLEGLWWSDDINDFRRQNKDKWKWTLMIMQPEYVTRESFRQARDIVKKKKDPEALEKVRFDSCFESLAAQIMHRGLFSEEGPTIDKLHDHIKLNGYLFTGKHHEIYLSDIRRAAPEKWRTIVRQPIRKT